MRNSSERGFGKPIEERVIVNHKNISLYGTYLFWKGDFMDVVEWKDIVGIQGIPDFRYLISNNGDVMYRKTGTILSKKNFK